MKDKIVWKNKSKNIVATYYPKFKNIYVGNGATIHDINEFKESLIKKDYPIVSIVGEYINEEPDVHNL